MSKALGTAPAKLATNRPSVAFDDENLDWDCSLDAPPAPQRSGRIEVSLRKIDITPSPV